MGYVIKFCNWIMGNQYLFALLIFAIIIEIILLPFGIKQQKNSIKQAKLRPKEMAIRKKYAGRNDKPTQQKMTEEIQTLYQKEGYNPMGGCLPLLIQFPIIIALYNIVLNPLRYICGLSTDTIAGISSVTGSFTGATYDLTRNLTLASDMRRVIAEHGVDAYAGVQGFAEHIQDIGDVPNLSFLNRFDLGLVPTSAFSSFAANWWLILIPVITFGAYFFSMKITRKLTYQPVTDDKAMGCSNNMMDIMMPLFSVYIAFITPAAIGVYWIFKSLIGVVKQAILKKAMPIPVFTEADYKAAEKEFNARPEKAPRNKSGRVVRSLHHIDDEDFEDTAEAGRARREALEAQEAADAEKKAENGKKGFLSSAPVKKDEKSEKKDKKEETKAEEDATPSEDNDNE
jgi:YidC/Oxa1 family membrane protein insertase